MPKVKGQVVYAYQGLEISVEPQPAKTARGQDRVWIHIRQKKNADLSAVWREEESLIYVKSADILFFRPPKKAA